MTVAPFALLAANDATISPDQVYKALAGLVCAASSTWALCNRPPASVKKHANFPEVRQLAIVLISVFIALIVGALGQPQEQLLAWMAIVATAFGATLFFVVLQQSQRFKRTPLPVWMLFLFFLYTCSISFGATSASLYFLLKGADKSASQAPIHTSSLRKGGK
jgi:hypothetical protein